MRSLLVLYLENTPPLPTEQLEQKRINIVQDVLCETDCGQAEYVGLISVEDYAARVERGEVVQWTPLSPFFDLLTSRCCFSKMKKFDEFRFSD